MQTTFYTVDVFTQTRFSGAQIAVLPEAHHLTREQMQHIAREFNLSETVFVTAQKDGAFHLRLFSPLKEVGIGSHTIVAAAQVLANTGKIDLTQQHTAISLIHAAGELQAHITQENGKPTLTQFAICTAPTVDNYVPSKVEFSDILSLKSAAMDHRDFHSLLVSNNGLYLVVPVKTYDDVRSATFNANAWGDSQAPLTMAQHILLFSTNTESNGPDFHLRLLGPEIGVHEDPPVGAAIPAFSAYLCAHKHIAKGTHKFTVERGTRSTRQSHIDVEMDNKQTDTLMIRVGGEAVAVSEGTITLTD